MPPKGQQRKNAKQKLLPLAVSKKRQLGSHCPLLLEGKHPRKEKTLFASSLPPLAATFFRWKKNSASQQPPLAGAKLTQDCSSSPLGTTDKRSSKRKKKVAVPKGDGNWEVVVSTRLCPFLLRSKGQKEQKSLGEQIKKKK